MTRSILTIAQALGLVCTLALPSAAFAGDAANGEKVFKRCMACHTVEAGAPNKIGPNLHGVVGRMAGTLDGYSYSTAMAGAGFIWTPEQLDAYLTKPKDLVPGNKMAFVGLPKAEDRADVIEYLKTNSP